MKTHLRKSKASGSTLAKIDKAIARGWSPGAGSVRDFLGRKSLRKGVKS